MKSCSTRSSWTGGPTLPFLPRNLGEHAPQLILRADPPGGALGHRLAGLSGLFDQVAIADLGVVVMGVEQGVGAIGLDEFGVGDGMRGATRHLLARATTGYVGAADLPSDVLARAARRKLSGLEQAEAQMIMRALHEAGGNKQQAADTLGIARSTLYRKVRALGLDLRVNAY